MDREALEARFREGYAAFNSGDYEAAATWMREDVELHSIGPQGVIRGRDAVLEFMRPDALVDLWIELLDIEVRDSVLLVHHIARARGRESGIPLEQEGWQVWWADEDGLGYRSRVFTDGGEALRAAGWADQAD